MIISTATPAVFAGQHEEIITAAEKIAADNSAQEEQAETVIPDAETPLAPGFAKASPIVKTTCVIILAGVAAFFIIYGITKYRKLDKEKNYLV